MLSCIQIFQMFSDRVCASSLSLSTLQDGGRPAERPEHPDPAGPAERLGGRPCGALGLRHRVVALCPPLCRSTGHPSQPHPGQPRPEAAEGHSGGGRDGLQEAPQVRHVNSWSSRDGRTPLFSNRQSHDALTGAVISSWAFLNVA